VHQEASVCSLRTHTKVRPPFEEAIAFLLLEPGSIVLKRHDCMCAFSAVNSEVSKVPFADVLQRHRGVRRWRRLAHWQEASTKAVDDGEHIRAMAISPELMAQATFFEPSPSPLPYRI
jgi:hypothetical protein